MEKKVEKAKKDGAEEEWRSTLIRTHLRKSVLTHFPSLDPSVAERCLGEIFRGGFGTPTHPPYAFMIQSAVSGLNEEGGSTKEAISTYIKREFGGLPWAHNAVLDLHLARGCHDGDIAQHGERFVLKDAVDDLAFAVAKPRFSKVYTRRRNPKCVDEEATMKQPDQSQNDAMLGLGLSLSLGLGLGLGLGVTRPSMLNEEAEARQEKNPTMNQDGKSPNLMLQVDGAQKDVMLGIAKPKILSVYTRKMK